VSGEYDDDDAENQNDDRENPSRDWIYRKTWGISGRATKDALFHCGFVFSYTYTHYITHSNVILQPWKGSLFLPCSKGGSKEEGCLLIWR
jgi:hypothetical protein